MELTRASPTRLIDHVSCTIAVRFVSLRARMGWLLTLTAALLLAACGGGGSGNAGPPQITLSTPTTSYAVSASVIDQPPAPIRVSLSVVNGSPGTIYYFVASYTAGGIASVDEVSHLTQSDVVAISLKAPALLSPGTYTDTATFTLCADQYCQSTLPGSSVKVTVAYTVTGASGSNVPVASLADSTVSVTEFDTDPDGTTVDVTMNFSKFVNVTPVVTVSTTTTGVQTALYLDGPTVGSGRIEISTRPGAILGKGTYDDTVTVTVCLDDASCANTAGTPLKIAVHYTVTDTQTVSGPNGYRVRILKLPTNDIAWDAIHSQLYLSTPPDPSVANDPGSVRTLDPATLTLGNPIVVGQLPSILSVSDDGQFLYALANDGVRRMQIPALTLDLTIPQYVTDLAVAPGHPHSVALAAVNASATYIYDDGIARTGSGPRSWYLAWSPDATSLYGLDVNLSNFYTFGIDSTGVISMTSVPVGVGATRFRFDQGLVYLESGFILDPTTGNVVRQLQNAGLLVPDAPHGKIFALVFTGSGYALGSFDINTFQPIATVPIPSFVDGGVRLIRWGSNGLALTSGPSGLITLIDGSFVGP